MLKKILLVLCLFVSMNIHAQNADVRIGQLVNESNWFELEQALKETPADSISPFLRQLATAMTHHYFNRSDSACIVFAELLNSYPQELGDMTLNISMLMAMNLARSDRYAEAAALMQSLCNQLGAMGADSTAIGGLLVLEQQFRVYADNAPICQPLHSEGTYRIPMKIHDAMHRARKANGNGHFIAMDGYINGKESLLVFDTGAGANVISMDLTDTYGLRLLDTAIPMAGVGMQTGRCAIVDTLRIGDMAWTNVPFLVVDVRTGNAEADSVGTSLPPVLGLSMMFRMQEIRMDFEHGQFIIPEVLSPNPLGESNLLRTDGDVLRLRTKDDDGQYLYLHFDTGGYNTTFLPRWYERHKDEVLMTGTPDSLRIAGVGGVNVTRSYRLSNRQFRIGNGTAMLDTVHVDTGIGLHSGENSRAEYLNGEEDGTLGLDILERFRLVILNLKDMYMEAIPYARQKSLK